MNNANEPSGIFAIDPVRVRVLRDAAKAAVSTASFRHVAGEIGISRSGLWQFLEGSTPHPRTYNRLLMWHVRQHESAGAGPDLDTVRSALDALLNGIPEPTRSLARTKILRAVAWGHREAGLNTPAWLSDARGGLDQWDGP
jgi:hypothetical protein